MKNHWTINKNHAFYENFRDEINKIGKAELGELSEDSGNVVDLIRDEYKKLIEHIKFQNENLPEELKLTVVSECEPGVDTNQPSCDGVQANQSVKFKVELEMKKGPARGENFRLILLYRKMSSTGLIYEIFLKAHKSWPWKMSRDQGPAQSKETPIQYFWHVWWYWG